MPRHDYYVMHRERSLQLAREHYQRRRAYIITRASNYQKKHREERNVYHRQYMKSHLKQREKHNARRRILRHQNPLKVRIEKARYRRRLSTNIILNDSFQNAHLHHLTNNVAIHIPAEIHSATPHRLTDDYSMTLINTKVKEWVGANNIQVLPNFWEEPVPITEDEAVRRAKKLRDIMRR